jgi:hypothetical protein
MDWGETGKDKPEPEVVEIPKRVDYRGSQAVIEPDRLV